MKKIYAALAVLSFHVVLLTAGALECDTIPFTQGVIQGILSLIAFGVFSRLAENNGGWHKTKDAFIPTPNDKDGKAA